MTGRVFIVTAFRGRVTWKTWTRRTLFIGQPTEDGGGCQDSLWVLGGTSPGPKSGWNIYYLSTAPTSSPSMSLPPNGKGKIWTATPESGVRSPDSDPKIVHWFPPRPRLVWSCLCVWVLPPGAGSSCGWGLMYSYGQNDHRGAFVAGSQVRLDYWFHQREEQWRF